MGLLDTYSCSIWIVLFIEVDDMKKRMHLIVEGRVHGVGFRFTTRDKGKILGLTGWVKNNPDGSVEVLAEGEEENLSKLLEFCRNGPSMAHVVDIKINWSDCEDEFDSFSIK